MNKALLLLAVVAICHYGYLPFSDDQQEQSYLFYIFRGLEGAVLFGLVALELRDGPWSRMAFFACLVGAAEELSSAFCGAMAFGLQEATPNGLCTAQFGVMPYAVIGSALLVFALRSRKAE